MMPLLLCNVNTTFIAAEGVGWGGPNTFAELPAVGWGQTSAEPRGGGMLGGGLRGGPAGI
eukprot:8914654-Alexandrium_andersonii.AAC.1